MLRQWEELKDKMQTVGKERAGSIHACRVQRNAGQKQQKTGPRQRNAGGAVMWRAHGAEQVLQSAEPELLWIP